MSNQKRAALGLTTCMQRYDDDDDDDDDDGNDDDEDDDDVDDADDDEYSCRASLCLPKYGRVASLSGPINIPIGVPRL